MAHRSRITRGARRATSWLEVEASQTALTAIGGTILASLDTAEKALRPFTIIRSHLRIYWESDQAAAEEFQLGAVGMAVVSDQASAAGVASVPTPVTDAASDAWFLHQFYASRFLFFSGVGIEPAGGLGMDIDSKAARKVNDSDDIVIVAEVDTSISSGITFTLQGRVLIKNH